jgi:hypothetical protein
MSDELRAAAEQILAGEIVGVGSGYVTTKEFPESWKALARCYLSDHPQDDGELVTEEWLDRVLPMKNDSNWTLFKHMPLQIEIEGPHGGFWLWILTDEEVPHRIREIKTRGDVRLLCRALGIELKEASHE